MILYSLAKNLSPNSPQKEILCTLLLVPCRCERKVLEADKSQMFRDLVDLRFLISAAAYQTNRSLFDKSTKIGTNIHYYTMNVFRY